MADPVTAGLILVGGSTLLSAAGDIQAGNAANKVAGYNANQAEENAKVVQQQAEQEVDMQQVRAKKMIGAISATYGASGVAQAGSAVDVLAASAASAELDKQTILYNGKLQAIGYQNQAALDRVRGRTAKVQSRYAAIGTLMKGGAQMYGMSGGGGGSGIGGADDAESEIGDAN